MLTNNSITSEYTLPDEGNNSSRDQTDSDDRLAVAYAREVKFSKPQQLTQPQCESKAESPSSPSHHLIHQREPKFYSGFGTHTVKDKDSPAAHGEEQITDETSQSIDLMDFIQTTIHDQPHQATPEFMATMNILIQSGSSEENIRTIMSANLAIKSLYVRMVSLSREEELDFQSAHSSYFKGKISNRLSKLMDVVQTYDFLSKNANSVIEAYNSLKLEHEAHYRLVRKSLFLSEQMGETVCVLASQYLKVRLAVGKLINDLNTDLVRLPTLLKPFVLSSLMCFEYTIESRLRDLDAVNKIAVRKPGIKMTPRKYSGIRLAVQPKLAEPRFEQSEINLSLFHLCRSIATVELFGRSRARTQLDILNQTRNRLFELIDRYATEAQVTIADMLLIPGANIIDKYLAYAELLHAAEAAPKRHTEARKAVLARITHLAAVNEASEAAATTQGIDGKAYRANLLQFLAEPRKFSQSWRRFPLSDHILLGVESACNGLNREIELKTFEDQCPRDMNAEKLREDLYNLDLWIHHLRSIELIHDDSLNACSSYRQLGSVREALQEVIRAHKASLEATFEEASKRITLGQIKETCAQAPLPAAGLLSPLESTLFSNPELLKTINNFLFANCELTINEWNEQQGKQFVSLLSKKHQSTHSRSLTAFIECCQHEGKINEHIKKYRMTLLTMYPYVTSIPAKHSLQFTKGKIKSFHEEIAQFIKLNKKVQSELQEWSKKLTKIKPKNDDAYEYLKLKLFAAAQNALQLSTEQQRQLNIGLDLMLEKRRQILTIDFPNLYSLEKHVYDVSAKKIKRQIKSAKKIGKNSDIPPGPASDTGQQVQPGKSGFFITTPLPGLGFTLDDSPPLNSLKIPCLESSRDSGLTGKRFLDQLSQQLHVRVAAYQTTNNNFYSPPPGEPASTTNHRGQISFSHFLAGTRVRLDDPTAIKQRNIFHQHIASQVGSLIHSKIPVVYMGSRALQTQLLSLWGARALEHLDKLPLPKIDPDITLRATTPRDTDLLILDKGQLATVKQKMHDTLLSAAQQSPDLQIDYEITTTDERTEIFYGTKCLTCNLILHKKGCRQPKHWIYVVDLVTCVDSDASALHTFDSPPLPSGKTTHCRRIDIIIMDELNLAVSMAAGPPRALMAMIRISILAALEAANPTLDNTARLALIYALDTVHHHFPDPAFDQLATDLRSRTFTVVEHEGQLLGVRQSATPDKTS